MNLKFISKVLFVFVIIGLLFSWWKYGSFPCFLFKKQPSFESKIQDSQAKYAELKKGATNFFAVESEYDFSRMIFLFEQVNSLIKNNLFDPSSALQKGFLRWLLQEFELEFDLFSKYLALQKNNRLEKSKVRSRRSLFYYRRALINSLTKIKTLLAQKPRLKSLK